MVLLGHSGCGKTTLTRLINGLIPEFYAGDFYGDIYIEGKNTDDLYLSDLSEVVGSVFQDPRSQFFTMDTTAEMAFSCENAGMKQQEIVDGILRTAELLDMEYLLERNIFELSSGEKQMVAIGSVCTYSPKILVFDEPSANLDLEATYRLKRAIIGLKKKGYTIVISEHRLHYLTDVCDRAVFMKRGKIERIFSREELSRFTNSLANTRGMRSVHLENIAIEKKAKHFGDMVLKLENLSFCYEKNKNIFTHLNLEVKAGQIIGIIGHNGVGKSTFLELLCGLKKECEGKIYFQDQAANAKKRQKQSYYVMQDSDCQLFTESVEKELYLENAQNEMLCLKGHEILDRLGLAEYEKCHPAALSGGQKQRLCIAVSCMKDAQVICFDEPTSGLDYESMMSISSIFTDLAKQGKVLLVVTHDFEFLTQCCTHILYMENARRNEFFPIQEKAASELLEMMSNRATVSLNDPKKRKRVI